MILVLEGIDGSGKTTVAQLLMARLSEQGFTARVCKYSHCDFNDSFVQKQMERLRTIIWDPGQEEPETDLLGTHFYLFSLAAWSSAKQKHCISQIERSNEIYIFDGWHYRTIAKAFLRQHFPKPWLQSLFSTVASPDAVVLLDVEPSVSWTRRAHFKASEIGRWDGFTGDRYSSYCEYQELVRRELLAFAADRNWLIVEQTAGRHVTDVLDNICSRIQPLLESAR